MDYKDKLRIMNFVRLSFRQSQTMKDVLANAVSLRHKGVRGGKMYWCANCPNTFLAKDVQVDHISPVIFIIESKRTIPLDIYIERVYCDISNLQVLCKPCHQNKTNLS